MKVCNQYLIIFLLFGLLFSFCRKKDSNQIQSTANSATTSGFYPGPPKPYKTVYVSNEIKEWGLFNVGSYWIYRDSISGIIDSIYVSSVDTTYDRSYYTKDSDIIYEVIHIKVNDFSEDYYSISAGDEMYYVCNSNLIFPVPCFILDTTVNNLVLYQIQQVNTTIPNLTIFGNQYTNVRFFRSTNYFQMHSSGNYYISESHFWKKNIGKIKFCHYPSMGTYWSDTYRCRELIRYNVSQ